MEFHRVGFDILQNTPTRERRKKRNEEEEEKKGRRGKKKRNETLHLKVRSLLNSERKKERKKDVA